MASIAGQQTYEIIFNFSLEIKVAQNIPTKFAKAKKVFYK